MPQTHREGIGMQKILLATKNKGKVAELTELVRLLNIQVVSLADMDVSKIPHVVEDGRTFEENALKKAREYYNTFKMPTMADDSGLEVDALNGEPGIYSARYAGDEATDRDNNEKLLQQLHGVPAEKRTAHFTCVIAVVDGEREPIVTKGYCHGLIAKEPKGSQGFGYDPIFFVPEKNKMMAELAKEEKNLISHRFHALQQLIKKLEKTQ